MSIALATWCFADATSRPVEWLGAWVNSDRDAVGCLGLRAIWTGAVLGAALLAFALLWPQIFSGRDDFSRVFETPWSGLGEDVDSAAAVDVMLRFLLWLATALLCLGLFAILLYRPVMSERSCTSEAVLQAVKKAKSDGQKASISVPRPKLPPGLRGTEGSAASWWLGWMAARIDSVLVAVNGGPGPAEGLRDIAARVRELGDRLPTLRLEGVETRLDRIEQAIKASAPDGRRDPVPPSFLATLEQKLVAIVMTGRWPGFSWNWQLVVVPPPAPAPATPPTCRLPPGSGAFHPRVRPQGARPCH